MNIAQTYAKTLFLIAASASLLLSACSKDSPPKPKTAAELIALAPWKWIRKQLAKDGGTHVEQTLSTVQKSAVYTFKADGTFTIVGNADGSTTVGTWTVTDAKTLTISTTDDDGKPVTGSIGFTVSETTLVWTMVGTFYSTNGDGTSVKWDTQISTFSHV